MSLWSCLTLREPMTVACQAPLSFGFSRQEYWSELLFPSPKHVNLVLFKVTMIHFPSPTRVHPDPLSWVLLTCSL